MKHPDWAAAYILVDWKKRGRNAVQAVSAAFENYERKQNDPAWADNRVGMQPCRGHRARAPGRCHREAGGLRRRPQGCSGRHGMKMVIRAFNPLWSWK